jgi:Berberine and berberine like
MEHAARFKTYQAALADAMAPWTPGRKALNFLSGDETAPGIVAGSYAPEVYKRLATVKRELDPHNVFRVNHNIPPAAARQNAPAGKDTPGRPPVPEMVRALVEQLTSPSTGQGRRPEDPA